METSISKFPIIIQSQPGHGRRHDKSTFVRAHVMERYHRHRKLGNTTTKTSIPQEDIGKRAHGQDSGTAQESRPGKSSYMEIFVENAAPAILNHRVRKFSNVRHDASPVLGSEDRPSENGSKAVRPAALPSRIDYLQLGDPREQESSKFRLIFNAYSQLLEARQTLLDPLSKSWIPAAFTDLALFHAILFNFSQHLYALCSIDHERPSLLGHKVSAIRQISTRMESPSEACADPIIASILCLVSHELLNGDAAALQSHIRGLRQIIAVRGGVDTLGLSGTLKAVYSSYEVLLATIFKSWVTNLPPVPVTSCPNRMYPVRWNIFTFSQDPVDLALHGLSSEVIHMLSTLERVFAYPDTFIESNLHLDPQIPPLPLPGRPTIGEESDYEATTNRVYDHMLASIRLAATVHFSPIRPHGTVEQLKYHLNESFTWSSWHFIPGVLLWCFIAGVVSSKERPERTWFVANLIRLVTGLALEKWDALKETLHYFNRLGLKD